MLFSQRFAVSKQNNEQGTVTGDFVCYLDGEFYERGGMANGYNITASVTLLSCHIGCVEVAEEEIEFCLWDQSTEYGEHYLCNFPLTGDKLSDECLESNEDIRIILRNFEFDTQDVYEVSIGVSASIMGTADPDGVLLNPTGGSIWGTLTVREFYLCLGCTE
jgi:hypothetical protein